MTNGEILTRTVSEWVASIVTDAAKQAAENRGFMHLDFIFKNIINPTEAIATINEGFIAPFVKDITDNISDDLIPSTSVRLVEGIRNTRKTISKPLVIPFTGIKIDADTIDFLKCSLVDNFEKNKKISDENNDKEASQPQLPPA